MKKFLATILALVYLATAIGGEMQKLYWMDKLVPCDLGARINNKNSVAFSGIGQTSANKYGKESTSCCKDHQKQVEMVNHQKNGAGIFLVRISAIPPAFFDYHYRYVPSFSEEYPVTNAPPPSENVSVFILNCVLRI